MSDPFNCPTCGAHDYGLFASAMVGCPHCLIDENRRLRDGLRWWLDVRMVGYTDKQYGKGELRKLLTTVKS